MRKDEKSTLIFCELRKKWLVLTPEEWVRQNFIRFLMSELGCSLASLDAEVPVKVNQLSQRVDIMVYKNGKAFLLCECKEPKVELTQETLNQALRYNQVMKAPYVCLTNGLRHIFAQVNSEENQLKFIKKLPVFK